MSQQKDLHMMALSHIVDAVQITRSNNIMQGIKFQLRLPEDVRAWLEADAERNDRSMNGQVVAILRERMKRQTEEAAERKPAAAN
ncbi:Arc family DNA-binding protein [Massilia cellulosiltytica]|nr:Arc family DNA-binding protein [Telluria cellulosilytica]